MNDIVSTPNSLARYHMTDILSKLLTWSIKIAEKNQLDIQEAVLDTVSGDASFRQYFRLKAKPHNLIIVNSPPDKESNEEFIAIAQSWFQQGIQVPEVIAYDAQAGFMALSDLGDNLLLPVLTDDTVDHYYHAALEELHKIACSSEPEDYPLPAYDEDKLLEEMQLLPTWFCKQHLQVENIEFNLGDFFKLLIDNVINQKSVVVHRDFHARNLMLMNDESLGIIDFQDAVTGPITYDVVSLLKDCYIAWPRSKVLNWLEDYRGIAESEMGSEAFIKAFDFMGLQRHIKVLGIFARLYHRDGKSGYLNDLPLVLAYTVDASARYSECAAFSEWLQSTIVPLYFERFPEHEKHYQQHLQVIQS